MKALLHLPSQRLISLYFQAYRRMAKADGVSCKHSYDWATVRIEKPGWYRALRTIIAAAKWKERQEKRQQRLIEDQAWHAGEILSWLHACGF
jgi:hypothetical protein